MEFVLVHFARPVDLVLSIWCTKCGASISLQLIWCFIAIAENPAEQFFPLDCWQVTLCTYVNIWNISSLAIRIPQLKSTMGTKITISLCVLFVRRLLHQDCMHTWESCTWIITGMIGIPFLLFKGKIPIKVGAKQISKDRVQNFCGLCQCHACPLLLRLNWYL